MTQDGTVRIIRLYAFYRYTLLVSITALLGSLLYLRYKPDDDPGSAALYPFVFLAVVLYGVTFLVFHWRLRIDSLGIHRRRFILWDHWSWDDFENGRVEATSNRYEFLASSRSMLLRKLSFGYASVKDIEYLCACIKRHWKQPPAATANDELMIQLGYRAFRGTRIRMSAAGIEITSRRCTRSYAWRDVGKAFAINHNRDYAGFDSLEITLGDRVLKFVVVDSVPNWSGASPEEIVSILKKHLVLTQLHIVSLTGEFETLEELDTWRAQRGTNLRGSRSIGHVFVALTVLGWGWGIRNLSIKITRAPSQLTLDYIDELVPLFFLLIWSAALVIQIVHFRRFEQEMDRVYAFEKARVGQMARQVER